MAKVVIFGTSEIAEIARFYFENDTEHDVVAFTADRQYTTQDSFGGLPLVAFEEVEKLYPPSDHSMFIAISYAQVNKLRAAKFESARSKGYDLVSYISSKATVWPGLKTGRNCFILEDNTLQPFVEIGDNVTLWSGNHIGHHSKIGDHCFISSHVVISGGVVVNPYCFIGVNSTVRDHVEIGRECVIGAGCLISKNTEDRQVFAGEATAPSRVPSNRLKKI